MRGWLEVNVPFTDPFVTHLEAVQNCHRKNIMCSYPFPPFWTSQLLLLQFKFTANGLLGYRISYKCLIIELQGLTFITADAILHTLNQIMLRKLLNPE